MPEGTTPDHGVNVIGVAASILAMFFRANIVVPSLLASLAVALAFSGSLTGVVISIFSTSLVQAKQWLGIFFVIALITSLFNALRSLGADQVMFLPFSRVRNSRCLACVIPFRRASDPAERRCGRPRRAAGGDDHRHRSIGLCGPAADRRAGGDGSVGRRMIGRGPGDRVVIATGGGEVQPGAGLEAGRTTLLPTHHPLGGGNSAGRPDRPKTPRSRSPWLLGDGPDGAKPL